MKNQVPATKYQTNFKFKFSSLVLVWTLVFGSCYLAPSALAATFSTNEVVETTESVGDDVFFAGERVTVKHAITDDAYLAGSIVETEDEIGEDLMAAGNSVTVNSEIGDDAFLAGDRVVFDSGSSVGDLFAAGRSVELREETLVDGDAYLAGADVTLNGVIQGTVRVGSDTVHVGPTAVIVGDLITHGSETPVIAEGARIEGTLRHTSVDPREHTRDSRSMLGKWVYTVVTFFIVSLVLLYVAPRLSARVLEHIYTSTLSSFGFGFLWLIAFVPATILLFLTVIGWPLALATLFLTALLFLLSCFFMPIVIGTWTARKLDSRVKLPRPWQQLLLGSVIVATLHFVPVLGQLVLFVVTLAIAGVLVRTLKSNA